MTNKKAAQVTFQESLTIFPVALGMIVANSNWPKTSLKTGPTSAKNRVLRVNYRHIYMIDMIDI